MQNIRVFSSLENLSETFTQFVLEICESKPGAIHIALSGGSTPKFVFDYWSQRAADTLPWERIHLYWGDERCVAPSDDMSNYKMTYDHLIAHITIPQENIHRVYGENNPQEEAERYAAELPERFDLILLGMGDDGHTASIFPHQMDLWYSTNSCVVATHPDTGMERISFTGKVINAAQQIAFLVTGKAKADKVEQILYQLEKSKSLYPAALVQPREGNLLWFLDTEAASLLSL